MKLNRAAFILALVMTSVRATDTYFRVRSTSCFRDTNAYFCLDELKLYGTSNNQISYAGATFIGSSTAGGSYGFASAFDNTGQDFCSNWTAGCVGWIGVRLSAPAVVGRYDMQADVANDTPDDFTFESSSDGTTWTVLDTRTGIQWTSGATKSFILAPVTPPPTSNQPSKSPSKQPTKLPTKIPTKSPAGSPTSNAPTSLLWFPDWEGSNNRCLSDGSEPDYMRHNPSVYLFGTQADCCNKHYQWAYADCIGSTSASTGSGDKWYADWTSGDDTCKKDGSAPDYMIVNESLWLHDDQEECCEKYFSYKINTCMGASNSASSTGKYYPDWSRGNDSCSVDDASTPAPEYMRVSKVWFSDSLEQCCDSYYGYNKVGCMGTSATGSEKYYVDWSTHKCMKDCPLGSGTDCGGLSDRDWADEEFPDKKSCCMKYVDYDYKNCMA